MKMIVRPAAFASLLIPIAIVVQVGIALQQQVVSAPLSPVNERWRASQTKLARTPRETRARLDQHFNFTGVRAETPLKEGLEILANTFHVTILIDTEAFKFDLQIAEPENLPIALPKLDNVSCRFVLALMLKQINGGYVIDGDDGIIWVTTLQRTTAELAVLQPISISFDRKPLVEALREIADRYRFTIVLDTKRTGDQGQTLVSADFFDMRLESAVRLLANMAELKVVRVDRALYVTTPEHAAIIFKDEQEYWERPGGCGCND
jgi:hypothetical protein